LTIDNCQSYRLVERIGRRNWISSEDDPQGVGLHCFVGVLPKAFPLRYSREGIIALGAQPRRGGLGERENGSRSQTGNWQDGFPTWEVGTANFQIRVPRWHENSFDREPLGLGDAGNRICLDYIESARPPSFIVGWFLYSRNQSYMSEVHHSIHRKEV